MLINQHTPLYGTQYPSPQHFPYEQGQQPNLPLYPQHGYCPRQNVFD